MLLELLYSELRSEISKILSRGKNPLSNYNDSEAFQNFKPDEVIPGSAKEKTGATQAIALHTAIDIPRWAGGGLRIGWENGWRMDSVNIDSEAEDAVNNDGPVMSILYQPGAGKAESTFATIGGVNAHDVALDMDTEVGCITEDESMKLEE